MHWVFLLIILCHQTWLYIQRGTFDPFAVETFVDLVALLIGFVGTLIDPRAIELMTSNLDFGLMIVGGLLAMYAGLHIKFAPRKPRLIQTSAISDRWFWISATVFALSIAKITLDSASLAGGLASWLFGSRTSIAADTATSGAGAVFYQIALGAQAGILMGVARFARERRWRMAVLSYLSLILGLFCIFTTRFQFVVLFLLPLYYVHYRIRPIRVQWLALGLIPLAALMIFLNVFRGGGTKALGENISASDALAASSVVAPSYLLSPVTNLWDLREHGGLEYEYGMNYVYLLLTPVPRALWKDKPLTSFANRWTTRLQGDQVDQFGGINISTFTAWGEGFGQFGIPGAIFNLALFGFLLRVARDYCARHQDLILVYAFASILCATYLRDGTSSVFFCLINVVGAAWLVLKLQNLRIRLSERPLPA